MDLIWIAVSFLAGSVFGAMAYRYQLKKDPTKLERWAAEAKAAGKRAGF